MPDEERPDENGAVAVTSGPAPADSAAPPTSTGADGPADLDIRLAPSTPSVADGSTAPRGAAYGDAGSADGRKPETPVEILQQRDAPPLNTRSDETEPTSNKLNLSRGDRYNTRVGTADGPVAIGSSAVSVQVKLVSGEQITLTRYELTGDDLKQHRHRYVEGRSFPSALSTLRANGVVIIHGPDGSGRRAAGHSLLQRLFAEGRVTAVGGLVIPDGVSVGDVVSRSEVFPDGWGLVLELRDSAGLADGLGVEAYRTVVGHGSRGYVVLLCPPADETETSPYAVTHDWPDPATVLKRYLEAEAPRLAPDTLRDALADTSIKEHLANNRRPSQVVKLARALVEGLQQGTPAGIVVAALEPDWRAVARKALEDALGTSSATDPFGGPRRQALRTAYAIFDGIELVDVFSAAEQLLSMLRLVEAPDSTPARPVFDDGLDKLLYPEMLGDSDLGEEQSPRRAQLRNSALSDAFLDVAWNDYDTTREVLLHWLDQVVLTGRPAMRLRAAQTVGKLAGYDFEKVMANLIRPWALDTNGMRRQAAAWALEQVSRNERFAIRVRRRVSDWVLSNDPELHDTAARVHGTGLGIAIPSEAMNELRAIAADPRQRAYRSVGRAVASIYQADSASAGMVIDQLDKWLDDASLDIGAHATWAVLFLARLLGRDRHDWPQLLADATGSPELRPALVRMWRAALTDPATTYPAWDLLRQWLELPYRTSGPQEQLTSALLDLAADTLADSRLRKRGLWHLRLWRGRRPEDLLLKEIIDRLTEDRVR